MYQAIILHADIHESAEVHYISYCSCHFHIYFKILKRLHIVSENHRRRIFTRVPCRLFHFFDNVRQSHFAHSKVSGHGRNALLQGLSRVCRFDFLFHILIAACSHSLRVNPQLFHHSLSCAIGFRMNRCCVQRVFSLGNSHETCTLVESLFSQLRHLHQFLSVVEASMLFSVGHDVLGDSHVYTCNIRKQ